MLKDLGQPIDVPLLKFHSYRYLITFLEVGDKQSLL